MTYHTLDYWREWQQRHNTAVNAGTACPDDCPVCDAEPVEVGAGKSTRNTQSVAA